MLGLLLASRVVVMGSDPPKVDGKTGRNPYPLYPGMLLSNRAELGVSRRTLRPDRGANQLFAAWLSLWVGLAKSVQVVLALL